MSSPFAVFLRDLRLRNNFRQQEMADQLGYEQSYISALELGARGPSKELLEALLKKIPLSEKDQADLWVAVNESGRRFVLPAEVSTDTYRFCHALWAKIETLHPAVIRAMWDLLQLEDEISDQPRFRPARMRRRVRERMEAEM